MYFGFGDHYRQNLDDFVLPIKPHAWKRGAFIAKLPWARMPYVL